MTPEEAECLEKGLRISLAELRGQQSKKEQLLEPFLSDNEMPRLVEAFVYVALTAVEGISRAKGIPFQEALRSVEELTGVSLFPELPVGPWNEIIDLASAVKRSHEEARAMPLSMDVPSAINAAFRLAISSLTDLSKTPHFGHMSPAELAGMFIKGIEDGYAY
ncbi:hypothetical protein [Thermomonospora amylolytica]|uniref:hypothetical protein n=1 Tax=Thermomonospora amylolytica TaxID=1411117 RepID=UPI00130062D2|nr:hypothetical protein [Thermomonospora amylolytica]